MARKFLRKLSEIKMATEHECYHSKIDFLTSTCSSYKNTIILHTPLPCAGFSSIVDYREFPHKDRGRRSHSYALKSFNLLTLPAQFQ